MGFTYRHGSADLTAGHSLAAQASELEIAYLSNAHWIRVLWEAATMAWSG